MVCPEQEGSTTITMKTSGHEETYYTAVSSYADGIKLPLIIISEQKTIQNNKISHFLHFHHKNKGGASYCLKNTVWPNHLNLYMSKSLY